MTRWRPGWRRSGSASKAFPRSSSNSALTLRYEGKQELHPQPSPLSPIPASQGGEGQPTVRSGAKGHVNCFGTKIIPRQLPNNSTSITVRFQAVSPGIGCLLVRIRGVQRGVTAEIEGRVLGVVATPGPNLNTWVGTRRVFHVVIPFFFFSVTLKPRVQ